MTPRTLALTAGFSYLAIFFLAIYANFFVLDALLNDPLLSVVNSEMHIRFGIMAFLLAAVFDTIVAWALYEMYPNHSFTRLSTYFRIMHAAIMALAVFALLNVLGATDANVILGHVTDFNNLWLIGLLFFGFHLLLLSRIVKKIKVIPWFLALAGFMYIVDTSAHFLMPNYQTYADTFLMMVAVPAILGEMSFSLWLLFKGGKETQFVSD